MKLADHKGYQGNQQHNNYKCAVNVLYDAFYREVNLKTIAQKDERGSQTHEILS